jgi:hypothetical protein
VLFRSHLWLIMLGRNSQLIPVLLWTDHDAAGSLTVSQLRLKQEGTGRWRNLNLWTLGEGAARPPAAPTDLTASAVGGSRITLTWKSTGPGAAASTYRIFRATTPGVAPTDATLIAAGVRGDRWEDLSLQPQTRYCYQVQAQNVVGELSGFAACEGLTATGGAWSLLVSAARPAHLEPPLLTGLDDTTGQRFLWGAGMPASMTTPPAEGVAEYAVNIPHAGKYALWGRVLAPNDGSDSWWLSLDSYQKGDWHLWYTGAGPDWRWSPIDRGADLAAGPQTLRFTYREANCKLSDMVITDDLTLDLGAGTP